MAQQPPMQATDTFVATMPGGGDHLVTKGQVLPFGHPLVKRDRDGSGTLFRPLDLGGEDEPEPEDTKSEPEPRSAPAKAEAPPEPVKAAAAKPAPKTAGK